VIKKSNPVFCGFRVFVTYLLEQINLLCTQQTDWTYIDAILCGVFDGMHHHEVMEFSTLYSSIMALDMYFKSDAKNARRIPTLLYKGLVRSSFEKRFDFLSLKKDLILSRGSVRYIIAFN